MCVYIYIYGSDVLGENSAGKVGEKRCGDLDIKTKNRNKKTTQMKQCVHAGKVVQC